MDKTPRLLEPAPDWTPEERPTLPGSPAAIAHSTPKKLIYFFIGLVVAISGSLSNGFITANLPLIQGEYSLTPAEAAWIPAAYVMANISSNLLLFKARQQYGLRLFSEIGLVLFICVLILHIFVQTFEMALLVRIISGLVAAPLSSLGMYYIMQAFKRANFGRGIYLALGFQQLGIPLAWIISPYIVDVNDWSILYTFELGLALCCLAMVVSLKLPRSLRIAVFEKQDFFTFALLAPGFALICIVLTQGPILWWFEAKWLGYALIAGFSLVIIGLTYEHYRVNPLLITRWLGSATTLKFIFGALAIRLLMSEQSYAAVNFLKTMGMGPDQFVSLYVVILLGIASGTIFSAVTFKRERIPWHLAGAVVLILFACTLDYHLTSDVRPENFYRSQFIVGFASGMFIGPLLLTGIIQALQKGPSHMVTFVVLFSATQSFGGLLGNSFFSTYQQVRTQNYRAEIISDLSPTDPIVYQRIHTYQQSASKYTLDQHLQQNQALQNLHQGVTKEAQVRAYNDVIAMNGIFAIILFIWSMLNIFWAKYQIRKQQMMNSS
ncbi:MULTISPECIES: MFS transporter [unclassified Acinetobacter]|uniref:MFS transporter n=1 Tax=unclassified Acinetobacter TaxID=196816 RepID=UPI0025750AED|nr:MULTISPECIES: MFS transporter [unclassified Acinetobacter]MDM1762820.1 MFS transporter [Acinetobacter sp. 226-1]MDM1766299.1 MFS transporter [Acinetobacter sp. 226-4]